MTLPSPIEIRPLAGEAPEVSALFAQVARDVPHSFAPSETEVRSWLAAESPRLEVDGSLIAYRDGAVVGYARLGKGGPDAKPESWLTVAPGEGVIRSLVVAPEVPGVAEALAHAASERLDALGCTTCWAFEDELGPPFYNGGFGQLSARLVEPLGALSGAGWVVHAAELHLTADALPDLRAPHTPAGFRLRTGRTTTGEWSLDLTDPDGRPAGQCVWAPCSSRSAQPEARRRGYVWWLGIEERNRGRGLGRLLMQRAFAHMRDNGITGAWLTTSASNHVAQSLYLSLGFRVVDLSLLLRRSPKKSH
jgi:ribosomal protein S18 acetylase RimI-like enzyme